jgi:KUP system potassium uptake protein
MSESVGTPDSQSADAGQGQSASEQPAAEHNAQPQAAQDDGHGGSHGGHGGHVSKGRMFGLTLGSLGVVYGDIGTSPIYAIREALGHGAHVLVTGPKGHDGHPAVPFNPTVVYGALSIVFWALVIIISIKYLFFVMRADNHGEGGILALSALLPSKKQSADQPRSGIAAKAALGSGVLLLLGLFGTALLYGDGMITPAISVLSAVEGLELVSTSFTPYIIPISIAIIVGLFAVQRFGTGKVGQVFGPIMVVWFATLAVLGTKNIIGSPEVLKALNPIWAVRYFQANPWKGFLSMGSLFLVVTGGEALYADMGHFGRRPIMLGWFAVVLPALLLNYFGQGAQILKDKGEFLQEAFFRMAPKWGLLPLVLLATVATVIASQALISGAFSLTQQAVNLGYSPRVEIRHTSSTEKGQIYIPQINLALMVACVLLVLGFRTSSALAAAYGLAVTACMFITTLIFARVAQSHFKWSKTKAWIICGPLLAIDAVFLGANLFKIPQGGWFPLVVGLFVFTLLTTWKTGRAVVAQRLRRGAVTLPDYIASITGGKNPVTRVSGTGVFLFSEPGIVPPAMQANVRHNRVLHERVYVVSLFNENTPTVDAADRVQKVDLGFGVSQVTIHYGFMEQFDVHTDLSKDLTTDVRDAVYFLGRENLRPSPNDGMAPWRESLMRTMSRNTTDIGEFFQLPSDRVFEVGMKVDL